MCPQEFIFKKKWHLDDTNTEEFHVPGDFKKNFDMQDFLCGLGANFVADRPGKPMGWYFGAGMAGGKEAFAKTPAGKAATAARWWWWCCFVVVTGGRARDPLSWPRVVVQRAFVTATAALLS